MATEIPPLWLVIATLLSFVAGYGLGLMTCAKGRKYWTLHTARSATKGCVDVELWTYPEEFAPATVCRWTCCHASVFTDGLAIDNRVVRL